MTARTPLVSLTALLALCPLALGGEAEEAERAKLAARGVFKLETVKGEPVVGIDRRGDAAVGDLFEIRRGDALIGYAEVPEIQDGWPRLKFLLGTGRHGDVLTRVSLPMPAVQLLADDLACQEAKELKALCGERLKPVRIAERMRAPMADEALVVLYHAGAPFMMGDPIVEPHARRGGVVVADMMAYSHLRGISADESFHQKPPVLRIIDTGKLTRGLHEEARIPWYGTREVVVTEEKPDKPKTKGKRKPKRKPKTSAPRRRKARRYVARFCQGTPINQEQKRLATDASTDNTTLILETVGAGSILALDLISLNGRGGIDPGAKNKWVLVARALGTGPQYSIFRPEKPEFADLAAELDTLVDNHEGKVAKTMEGGASGGDNLVYSLTLGAKGKPLVLLVGCLEGSDWLSACAALRVAEVLLDNDAGDYKIDWLLQRLRIKVVPCLNIEGYKNATTANANGVALDRNVPYHWDEFEDKKARGTAPFSEPETAILKRLVEDEKPVALLDIGVDSYDDGYCMIRARDADRPQRDLCRRVRDIVAARLRHRFVLGDKPLALKLYKGAQQPSLANWAGSKGILAASLRICGDGEDSLVNTDVAVEAALAFLTATALSREKPPPPPKPPAPKKRIIKRRTRTTK